MGELNTEHFPNLFIPGAAKSGTSTLHDLLNQHPEISMSSTKEPFFMVHDDFDSNIDAFNLKYKDLFNTEDTIKYRGDSSTPYMLFPNFIERVKAQLNFQKKFIFILRNPVDRIYSHYWYIKGLGSESLNFRDAIIKDLNVEPQNSTRLPEGKFKHYFQYGLYGKWLENFYNNFDAEDIKVILFEDLKEHPLETINECFRFLNLTEQTSIQDIQSNKTNILKHSYIHKYVLRVINGKIKILKPFNKLIPKGFKTYIKKNSSEFVINLTKSNKAYPEITKEDRQWIADLYKEDVTLLQNSTNLNFSKWTDFN